jgi:putative addiction module killer protein
LSGGAARIASSHLAGIGVSGGFPAKQPADFLAPREELDSAALGNFGDCQAVGDGVSEMRIHFGPGYRVFLTRRGTFVYVLLIGGDKSTQKRDIKRALKMARELKT